jgi:ComF family protein
MNYITRWLTTFTHWLLPQSCFLCGDTSTLPVCAACLADLPYRKIACISCAKPLEEVSICSQCKKEPPPYTHTQALFSYTYPVNKLISAAKFNQNLALLNLLGNLMAQHLMIEPRPDVLIPVPLHPKRLRYRGYNQSSELAKCLTRQTDIPFNHTACQRIKNTRPQVGLSAKERQTNIKDAFTIRRLEPDWQHIAIIDDVMTTGGTVTELTNQLINAGAQRVDVWCCARKSE